MQIQNIIFDLDGTLLDTIADLTAGVNRTMREFGFPEYTQQAVRKMVGNGIRRLLAAAVPEGEAHARFEEIYSFFRRYYTAHCRDETRPYEGILELLSELKENNFGLAIVSNKNEQAVTELTAEFFDSMIPVAIGQGEQTRRKPAPDTVFEAMRRLGAVPENTLYVGDSEVDKMTADHAGLKCILVSWGFRERETLEALRPFGLIDEPSRLTAYLK